MRNFGLSLPQSGALALALGMLLVPNTLAQVQVHVAGGDLAGDAVGKVDVFKGIPFAAPPVGDLRWRPPQPAKPWSGVRPAHAYALACKQVPVRTMPPWTEEFMLQTGDSEDCLYLNVWTPATKPAGSAPLPVYVFIHGGAFHSGATSIAVYDGAAMAARGVVVVTIQYRLGVFGFLAHPELTAESPEHASGNYGLLDCLEALRWVRGNIAAFGGDPTRVTVGGQSAGAAAVHDLLASPMARGLVEGAIAESGSSLGPPMTTLAEAEKAGTAFGAAHGATSLAALRALPADSLLPAAGGGPAPRFAPIVDGWSLPEDPNRAVAAGHALDVPILTGMQADEGSSSPSYGHSSVAQLHETSAKAYGAGATTFDALYPASDDTQALAMSKSAARDRGLASMYLWASETAAHSHHPVYTYYWTHVLPWPQRPEFGAFHSSEVPYVLGNLDVLNRPFTAADRTLAEEAGTWWANFIRTGDPNAKGTSSWQPFDATKTQTFEINTDPHMQPLMKPDKLAFWKSVITPGARAANAGAE